jgi:hypothetical protein
MQWLIAQNWRKQCLMFLWAFALVAVARAQPRYVNAQDLSRSWLVRTSEGLMAPFLPEMNRSVRQIHLPLTLTDSTLILSLEVGANTYAFINNRLAYLFEQATPVYWASDSLGQVFGDTIVVTLYNHRIIRSLPRASWVVASQLVFSQTPKTTIAVPDNIPLLRIKDQGHDFLLIACIGLLLAISFIAPSGKPLLSWQVLLQQFGLFMKAKTETRRLPLASLLLFTAYFSFTVALFIFLLGYKSGKIPYLTYGLTHMSTWVTKFMAILLTTLAILLIKYLVIGLMSKLYHDRVLAGLHLQEYITLGQIFVALSLPVLIILASISADMSTDLADTALLIYISGLFSLSLFMTYRLNQGVSYRKMYLFSYLCATEYIPIVLSVKIFVLL